MRKKFRRSLSSAAKWSPRFGGWAILILIITIACHRFGVIEAPLFFIGSGLVFLLAVAGLGLAAQGFVDLWARGDKGGRSAIKGTLLALFGLMPFMVLGVFWFTLPSLYDVSSDLDSPPFERLPSRPLAALPLLQDFGEQASAQMTSWPELSGRRYDSSPDRILSAVIAVLGERGWPIEIFPLNAEDTEILLTALARVPVVGFTSDVIIRLRDEEEATKVDMRIIARDLPHDFGFGAHEIIEFMQQLDREVLLGGMEQVEDD